MSSRKTEIVTACPDLSGPTSSKFAGNGTHIVYPEVESLSKAEVDLGELLETARSGDYDALIAEARTRAESWLDRLARSREVGDPSLNFRWPHIGGLDGSPIAAATALRELRNTILERLSPPKELLVEENRNGSQELAETNFPYFKVAQLLHERLGAEYEYLTARREFWALLAVYVLPDVVLSCYRNTSKSKDRWEATIPVADGVPGAVLARFALGRRTFYTRDMLARIWWKYHVLCEALGQKPTSSQFRSAADSTWQERTKIYSYPPVVKFTAEPTPASELAKRLNVYLFTRNGHDLTAEQLEEWNKNTLETRPRP